MRLSNLANKPRKYIDSFNNNDKRNYEYKNLLNQFYQNSFIYLYINGWRM